MIFYDLFSSAESFPELSFVNTCARESQYLLLCEETHVLAEKGAICGGKKVLSFIRSAEILEKSR